jgi:CRISPR-associated protein Cas2
MNVQRINQYRFLWILVFFDLPTETRKQRKIAADFRKFLIKDGFQMFQFSVYMRFCSSAENADTHVKRVKANLPEDGKVAVFRITDKQFGMVDLYHGRNRREPPAVSRQLEFF